MKWIRIDAGIACDPKLQHLADALNVQLPHAIGLVVCTLCQFPTHARDGDISAIPDATLEKWAGWEGKRGKFAPAFRAAFCADGIVTGWEKHNGAAVRKADKDTERQAEYRAKKSGRPPESPPPVTRDMPRDITGDIVRDETRRTTSSEVVGAGGATPPLLHRFADARHQAAYAGAHRAVRNAAAFDATLESMAEGMGGPGGKPLTWHQLGTAILEAQAAGRDLTPQTLRNFAVKVAPAPETPKLALVPHDLPGTVRDRDGALVWHPGMPTPRPPADEIAANGWSVAA